MIEIKNVVKEFDGFRALDELSMTVPSGSVYGLVGPNGAGKSTIIRHLTGIYRQDSGEVLVDGQPVFENPSVKNRIAYIPDDIFFFSNASIGEMARFYRSIYPQFDAERFKKLGEVFGLDTKRQMRKLSKGMQKQAAFWMMMALRPEFLVLDEPVDGLDPVMRRQIWSLALEDVAGYGTTVLVSSHNLRELEDICDHVGIMHMGHMLLERSLSDLQDNFVKVQLVTENPLPPSLHILHESTLGRVQTLILRGDPQTVADELAASAPMLCDLLPLSLEEIFIYELGGTGYDVKNLVL